LTEIRLGDNLTLVAAQVNWFTQAGIET